MKNSIRIISLVIVSALIILSLVSCSDAKVTPPDIPPVTTTEKVPVPCNVSFANADNAPMTVYSGDFIQAPASPTLEERIFAGWYLDSDFVSKAAFPLEINTDTTLYARFYTYEEAFSAARENTIGESVSGYEYTYTTDLTVSYTLLSLSGKTEGKAIYSTIGDVSFYDEHKNSGALFADGTKYQIRRGITLQKVSENKNGKITSNETEEVDASYKFDSSSFAKALFAYSDEKLLSVTPTDVPNEYKLKTSFNASSAISLLGNNINNPLIEAAIAKLPETAVDTGMYVTFDNGEISSYRYEMKINSAGIELSLIYSLKFDNVGTAQSIIPKTFE